MAYANIDNIPGELDYSSDKFQNYIFNFKLISKKDKRERVINVIGTSLMVVEEYVRDRYRKSFWIEVV